MWLEEWVEVLVKQQKLRLSSGHKQTFFVEYFVRTGTLRYLETNIAK